MLKTDRMSRVLVMGTMDALPETVDYLYETRSFHVIDFKRDEVHDIGMPLAGADKASAKLLKMMSISTSLELESPEGADVDKVPVSQIGRELDAALAHMELEISAEMHARKEVEDLLSKKRADLAAVMPFSALDFPLSWFHGMESAAVHSGKVRGDPESGMKAVTDAYELIPCGDLLILVVAKAQEQEAMKVLAGHGFMEVRMPDIQEAPGSAIKRLNREIKDLEAKLAEVNGRLDKLKDANSHFIHAALENLTIEANKAETPLRFGTARYTFLIDAWVPERSVEELRSGLAKLKNGIVDMMPVEFGEEEEPPIFMNNPKPVRPMEMLLEMFSLPSYDEIDPSTLMFITFPIFYGLMLGDVGYGIVIMLLVLSGGLSKVMTKLGMAGGAPGLNKILFYCSITSIIFGALFNEFFGFEMFALHHHGEVTVVFTHIYYPEFTIPEILGFGPAHFPVLRGDTEMVGSMLVLCVLIGIVHLMLGYIAGFRNVWVQHGLKHAVLEKGGWCLILFGLAVFAFSAMPKLISGQGIQITDPQSLVGLAILATGVVMAFAVEGINTILELPGLTGNLLSYSRIYAIGLSSVGIALAFNEYMAVPALEAGGIGIVIGVLVLVAGHALNIGLGIIGPLIQTLRLHYVEFFTKFYKGGGVKFNPLRYDRKHTKEV